MVITIDGPAGSGKSTISSLLAQKISAQYINSGAFYRAVTYVALDLAPPINSLASSLEYENKAQDIDEKMLIQDEEYFIQTIIPRINWKNDSIIIQNTSNIQGLNKEYTLNKELFTPRIDNCVAPVSKIVPIRFAINARIQAICSEGNWIIEGRDAGKNIYPDAEYKFFLDASVETRAARRKKQYDNTQDIASISKEDIAITIQKRDHIDSNKGAHSLTKIDDAYYIDTSDYTIDEILIKVYNIINI